MSRQSSLIVMIMVCYCCGLSSSFEGNPLLCGSRDDRGFCKASDSNGFCNPQDFAVENPVDFHTTFLDSLGHSDIYDGGKKAGCYRVTFDPPVYTYFCCDRNFEAGCGDCFTSAINRMKEGCSGRSGGNVLLDTCSLRYEVYDICNPENDCCD